MSREPNEGRRRHKLMTAELAKALPAIGSQDGKGPETLFRVKFFSPYSARHTFFVSEFDGKDELFGFCVSPLEPSYDEWCYDSLENLASVTLQAPPPFPSGVHVLAIERDCHWMPKYAKDIPEWVAKFGTVVS